MDYQGSATSSSRKTHQELKQLSIQLQEKKGDCLPGGFISELPTVIYPKIPEIKRLGELKTIWDNWTIERQSTFTAKYGDIALLLPIEVDEQLLKAAMLFWDPSYRCFTFNREDLTPTVEEYAALLRISPPNPDKVFWKKSKKVPFRKKLAQMTGMDANIFVPMTKLKGKNECVQCDFLERYIVQNNNDNRVMDIFALVVYGTLIFPQSPGYVDAAVVDLIEQVDNQANPVPAIIAETIRSLNYCRRNRESSFVGCAQLFYIWIRSHFWGKCETSLRFCMNTMVPVEEFCRKEWPKNQTREQWVAALRDLDPTHVTWKAPWMNQDCMLYGCGDKMWVPLLGLWGVVSYAPLLVCRQYASEQFIPATQGLNQLEFAYGDAGYATQLVKLSALWSEPQRTNLARHGHNVAPGYLEWNSNRAKDVMLPARDDSVQPANPLPERIPTEIEILRRELEVERRKNMDLDHQYQADLGQYRYFLKIEEDKVKDEKKERASLLEDFKRLGLKNKRLEDELKGKNGNPSKRIKLMENTQRELEEAQKQTKEQQELTKYWKQQARELRSKMAEERKVWENKYGNDMRECSQKNAELKLKLRAGKIEQAELRAENQSIRDAIQAMEQSLVGHQNYIVQLQEDIVFQNVQHVRILGEVEWDKEAWKAQCLARQLYIKHTTEQIYKAVCKAHKMLEEAEALLQNFAPTGKNGQQLLNFIEEVRSHCEQVKAFYGYNCNMLNNV